MKNKILVVGAGGHCRAVLSILIKYNNFKVVGIADRDNKYINQKIMNSKVSYTWNDFEKIFNKGVNKAVLAVGSNDERKKLFKKLISIGFSIETLIDPSAKVSESASIGRGAVICMGAIIGPLVSIGENCIIYSGAIIDHETIIDKHSFIAPGVSIAGRVHINSGSFVGIGSSIKEGISIGENVLVGAGSVVLNNIKSNLRVAGIPASAIK